MRAPLSYVPALPAAIGVVSGIILSSIGLGGWCMLIPFGAFAWAYRRGFHYQSIVLLFTALGMLLCVAHKPYVPDKEIFSKTRTYMAKVESVTTTPRSLTCIVTVYAMDGDRTHPFDCRLTVLTPNQDVSPGETINFRAKLKSIINGAPIVPHEIDYNKYLALEGISCTAVSRLDQLQILKGQPWWQRQLRRIKDAMYNGIVCSPINDSTASFLVAVILGERALMPADTVEEFRVTGISHVLALSGLHVGIIAGFISILLFPIRALRRGRMYRSVVTLALIWLYAMIVGMSPSILRASLMLTVFIGASHMQNGYRPFNSLLLAIVFILCVNPLWLFAPGFQLSVSAVGTLLVANALIPERWKRKRMAYTLLMAILVPIAAMMGTGIIGIYYFNTFPVLFLLANIYASLILPWLLTLGIVLMLTTMVGLDITWLGMVVQSLNEALNWGISQLSAYPWAQISGIFMSAWVLLPYFTTLALAATAIRLRNKRLASMAFMALIITIATALATSERIPESELYITSNTSGATRVLIQTRGKAWLYSDAKDIEEDSIRCIDIYEGFLRSRGCETFSIIGRRTHINAGNVDIRFPQIRIGDTVIHIIEDAESLKTPKKNEIDYALVTRTYAKSVNDINKALAPRCLLLSRGLNGKRHDKLIRQCSDTTPYISHPNIAVSVGR